MSMKPRIIFKGTHYTACAMKDGSLIVTSNRKQGGKCLKGPQAQEWIDAIEQEDDKDIQHELCKAVINA